MKAPRVNRLIAGRLRPRRLNRAPSPALAIGIPWISVLFCSLSPFWPLPAAAPVLPPMGFIMLLAWRQVRPGLLPVWAGVPLGFFDDIYSGQPFGSATMLWPLAMIAFDVIEFRFPWRSFWFEWLIAAGLIVAYIVLTLAFVNLGPHTVPLTLVLPQIAVSVLGYPLAGRFVAWLDRLRLTPIVVVK